MSDYSTSMYENSASQHSEYGPFSSPETALNASRKKLEAEGYIFLERYTGKRKYSSTPDSQIFDIYFIETERGFKLFSQACSPYELRMVEGKTQIVSWLGRFGGRYELALASEDRDPRNFLDITENIHDLPTVVSDAYVEVPGYGLGSKMLDLLCQLLQKKKCIHVVAFSKSGLHKLSHHYHAHGYKDTRVIDQEKEFLIYEKGPFDLVEPARYLGWMYKVYRDGK